MINSNEIVQCFKNVCRIPFIGIVKEFCVNNKVRADYIMMTFLPIFIAIEVKNDLSDIRLLQLLRYSELFDLSLYLIPRDIYVDESIISEFEQRGIGLIQGSINEIVNGNLSTSTILVAPRLKIADIDLKHVIRLLDRLNLDEYSKRMFQNYCWNTRLFIKSMLRAHR